MESVKSPSPCRPIFGVLAAVIAALGLFALIVTSSLLFYKPSAHVVVIQLQVLWLTVFMARIAWNSWFANRVTFQIRLSTALLLMFAASGLIGMNAAPRKIPLVIPYLGMGNTTFPNNVVTSYGWPVGNMVQDTRTVLGDVDPMLQSLLTKAGSMRLDGGAVMVNLLVAIGLLFAAGIGIEWFVRRRAKP